MNLIPHTCLLCDQVCSAEVTIDLCEHCQRTLPWNDRCCPRCAAPMQTPHGPCADCESNPPAFIHCVAPLRYEDQPRFWIRQLKFHQGLVEGRLLGTLLAQAIQRQYVARQLPDVLVPVPLSMYRLATRGHNQALSLATVVGQYLKRPVNRRRARRIRHGPTQRALSRTARQSNPIGAFGSRPWHGERIAVIDDVMTTGATMDSMARALLAAGASEVHGWCATPTPALRQSPRPPSNRPC
jgi:ComF family protein